MIAVIDYGRGNLFSLSQALQRLEIAHEVTDDPDRVEAAERLIFPGVGAFGDAAEGLRQRGLADPLKRAITDGKPLLGICVGCQMLLSRGEEFGDHPGLAIVEGSVRRIPAPSPGDPNAIRIPNVGWRQLWNIAVHPVMQTLGPNDFVYFVHSFAPRPSNPMHIAATCPINGEDVPVAVAANNVVGVQFHPEKSGPTGLRLLKKFATVKFG